MPTEPKNEKITNKSDKVTDNNDDSNESNQHQEDKDRQKSDGSDPTQDEKNKKLKNQARDIHPQTPSMKKNIQQQKSRDNM